ncbi:MAG TPA: DUF1203 domain-containing protein [Pseudonocardiaceae bacterium]|jgi:hypothetical protein|nr:DUF1203 domain-containing protein [Pseudonocardiaceae bacterium]
MTMTMTITFRVEAIPATTLDRIRATGRDEAGNAPLARIDEDGGSPLRCCLRDAEPGERMLLIAYTPPGVAGPYAERGPVFVHAEPCAGYPAAHSYPMALGHRTQIVRGYDHDGNMATATIVADGDAAERELNTILSRPEIRVAHVRNVAAGCYNFAVWPTS